MAEVLDAANKAEVNLLEPTLDQLDVQPASAQADKPAPWRLICDKAYDSDPLRERLLMERDIDLICPHRKNRTRPSIQDGLDLHLPVIDGIALMGRPKESQPVLECLLFTAEGSIETAVDAMRQGAYDYVTKPIPNLPELDVRLQKAAEKSRLARRCFATSSKTHSLRVRSQQRWK